MGYGNDLNLMRKFPMDDGKRILQQNHALGPVKVLGI
jgi:hypothetical protein